MATDPQIALDKATAALTDDALSLLIDLTDTPET